MFNGLFQPTHLILILVVVLIVFGPGKLPEAGKAMGKAMKDMRNAFSGSDEEQKEKAATESTAAASPVPAPAQNNTVN
jgi:sec-independent protein translocase protein TatA